MLHQDGLAGQQAGAPAESRGKGDRRVLLRHQAFEYQLVEGAVEIAAAVEQAFGERELFAELRLEGRARFADQRVHVPVGRKQVGEHRQQAVAEIRDLAALDFEVEHAEELAVRPGVGHQRLAAGVVHDHGGRHAVVGVAAEDRVDAAHARRELEVHVHAVVRQQHHRLRALGARFVHRALQRFFLDAEAPVRHEVLGIGDRRVRKRLADDGDRHAVHGLDHIGRKHRVAEVGGFHVLRDEVDAALEIVVDDLLHAFGAEGELPVPGHDVHAEQLARVDHVLALGPQRGGRTLPGVAAVEQQRARPARLQLLHQGGEVGEAADFAVSLRRPLEVEVGVCVGLGGAGADAEMPQQRIADQVGWAAGHGRDAEIHVRFAEQNRQELRVAVGEMQQMDVAEARQVVDARGALGVGTAGQLRQGQAAGGGHPHDMQEFASIHAPAGPID